MQNSSANAADAKVKGRYPKEYKSWIMWEVAIPLTAPLAVFMILLAYWWATNAPQFSVRALISVSGSGDLFIFAAFLLINVGAKFRHLGDGGEQRDYIVEGDIDGDTPFAIAIVLLLVYMGARVGLEIMGTRDVEIYKFGYGSISMIVLVWIVVWIDSRVCQMHITQVQRKANATLVSSYYNDL